MSLALYDAALAAPAGPALLLRREDGRTDPLEVDRWRGGLDRADRRLLGELTGPTLDVGCGPGRLAAALTARGVDALGVDISRAAVEMTCRRGGFAVQQDLFDPLPRTGQWQHILLADGNVGIGGDPLALLRRLAEVLAPGGSLHVEVGSEPEATQLVRLESAAYGVGDWFRWAWLPLGSVHRVATAAGLRVIDSWQEGDRCFVMLAG